MKQRALIDLDLVLDTRYGTLVSMDAVAAEKLVSTMAYRERHADNFDVLTDGAIDLEEYKRLYAARNGDTLYHSKMTDLIYDLRREVKTAIADMARGVQDEDVRYDINAYRYGDLTRQEAEMIRRAVARYIPTPAKVEIVSIDPKELTPAYLMTQYEMMAWYDHEDWLKHHVDDLIALPIPSTVLLTPQIASSGTVPEPTEEIGNPFMCRSALLVQHIALHYLDTSVACYNPIIRQIVHNRRHSEHARPDDPHQEEASEQ